MDSHALAAERLQMARILVNLGHSYLRTTSVECSDDEEEEEEEEEEQEEQEEEQEEEGEEEEKHGEEEEDHQDGLENCFEVLDNERFSENTQHDFEEELQVQFDDELQQVNNEKQFETDNDCSVNVYKAPDFSGEKRNNFKCKNVRKLKSKKVLTRLDSERPKKTDRNEETESDSEMEISSEFTGEIHENIEEKQQMRTNNVNIKLDIEVDPDFEQESHENMSERASDEQLSDEDIYLELNIELPDTDYSQDDLESFQLLDSSAIQVEQHSYNREEDNILELEKAKQKCKNNLLQKFDREIEPPSVECPITNIIVENDVPHRLERQVQKESDEGLKHDREKQEVKTPTIQVFDKELHVSSDNSDFHEKLDGKEETKFKEKQHIIKNIQQLFDKENFFESNDKVQEQFDTHKNMVDMDVQMEFNDKCTVKALNCFNNESQNVEFNMNVQSNSEIELELEKQYNNENQNKDKHETLQMLGNQAECTVNSDIQTDDNNMETVLDNQCNVQEFEKVTLVKINREPNNDIEKNQIEFSKNIQLQFDKEIEEDLDNDFIVKLKNDIDLLELELEDEKQFKKEMIERFREDTKNNFDEHASELFDCEQNILDGSKHSRNIEKHESLISQIQQEIEALQIKAEEFDNDQDGELEKIINTKIKETQTYLGQANIFENLNLLLNKSSSVINDRLNTMCKQFLQEFNNASQIDSEKNFVDKNNKENGEKVQEETIETPQETVNQNFDVIVTFNSEVQQKDSIRQCAVNKNIQIEFYEEIQQKINESDESELKLSEDIQFDKNKQLQQSLNKTMRKILDKDIHNAVHLQLEFFRRPQIEESSQENSLQNKIYLELLKKKLFHNSEKIHTESGEKINHFEAESKELHEKCILSDDKFEETLKKSHLEFVEYENKVQKEIVENVLDESSDVDIEGLDDNEDQIHNYFTEDIEEVQDESEVSIVSNSESDKVSEKSDVDIERFEDETQGNLKEDIQRKTEAIIKNVVDAKFEKCVEKVLELFMDKFKERQSSSNEDVQSNIEKQIDEVLLLENNEKLKFEVLKSFKETNEVVEVVEDIVIKSNLAVNNVKNTDNEYEHSEESSSSEESSLSEVSSLDINPCVIKYSSSDECSSNSSIINILNSVCVSSSEAESSSSEAEVSFREELYGSEEEFSSTEEKDSSTDNEEVFNEEFEDTFLGEQKFASKDMDEEVFQEFDERSSELYRKSLQEVENKHKCKRRSKLEEKQRKKFEDLQMKMDLQNITNLDKIPLEFKLQQEQLEQDLHQQLKSFQKEFYKDLKLEYDQELQLNDKYESSSESSQAFDEQQQTFYELKDEFNNIKHEYEGFVQQKVFEELQRDVDDKTLLETEDCPEYFDNFDNVINVVDEDIHKEFIELKRDCHELEPEFKYNVLLDFDEDNLSQNFNPKPYNLMEKLHFKHRQKLCEFADAKTWPENRLYPSSLLDQLFEDPLEFKSNVIVITLYSIDIGYSVKIIMKKNQPPIETFYNYADDSVLDFVEQEELPPILLDTLDKAEPQLFYNGCVIAEIHNKFKGVLNGVYRVLLRPSNLSIQCDVKRIIAENSHLNWTYNRRLKLEKKILMACNRSMCMDTSPIAGLTVQLQHQMLSARTFILNPLKLKRMCSKLKPSMKDSFENLVINKLPSESQCESSKSMNVASDSEVHHILWKFDFRLQLLKIIKLYILRIIETQEHSMLLMNSKAESSINIRFRVNLETNELKTYIHVILSILKEKISPDMEVVRKYRNDSKSPDLFLSCVPTLFSNNIYNPTHADINQLINKLLENGPEYEFCITDFVNKKVESPLTPSQLSNDLKKTESDKNLLKIDSQMDQMTRKNIQFCSTKKLLNNTVNCFEPFEEPTTVDNQLDHQNKKAKHDKHDDKVMFTLSANTASSSSLKVMLPSVLGLSILNQSKNQAHEHSLKEEEHISSPNIFNCRGIKRKRTLP